MALLPLFVLLLLAVAVGVGASAVRGAPPSAELAVAAARQHARWTAAAAALFGVAAAVGTAAVGTANDSFGPASDGVTALLVPVAFGLVHTTVLAIGELTWPRPVGQVRHAQLVRRGLLDAAPRRLVRAGTATVPFAALVLGAGALLADADGRTFSVTAAGGAVGGAASPFAGADYSTPAALGLLALAMAALVTLRIVAERPAVSTGDDRIEAALRAASAHRVLRGAVGSALIVVGGLLAVSGLALRNASTGAGDTARAYGLDVGVLTGALPVTGAVLGVLGLALALAGLVLCAWCAPAVPADRQPALGA
ncbi:hypothetical protein GB931_13785 [Modestobacter sp. I12A-02628]|uniref:Uncharacterized protein n=1 Tax=Goekera deserti TaxID=2497753 RepID=A0A7K3WM75_9ACTN|nr:hypothetical protein [Goekera deserti]MPQ98974.1 hypothetical protein [Goekera deserti]NDI50578.1 hypothetical protein [Goekera deserti]NEL56633.1 hypothetical protein [Goekera deserti]